MNTSTSPESATRTRPFIGKIVVAVDLLHLGHAPRVMHSARCSVLVYQGEHDYGDQQ